MRKSLMLLTGFLWVMSFFLGQVSLSSAKEAVEAEGASKALQLREKLALTDEQVAQLKALVESEKAEFTPLIQKGLADIKLLGEKVKAGAPDAELNPIVDQIESGRRSIEAAKTKYIEKVRGILDPTQQSKLVLAVAVVKLAILQKLHKAKK